MGLSIWPVKVVPLPTRSGSNILLSNVVNSELATNNKQTTTIYDEFRTVGNDSTELVNKTKTTRVGETRSSVR